jgi:uracil-DNA glycosylase family 4
MSQSPDRRNTGVERLLEFERLFGVEELYVPSRKRSAKRAAARVAKKTTRPPATTAAPRAKTGPQPGTDARRKAVEEAKRRASDPKRSAAAASSAPPPSGVECDEFEIETLPGSTVDVELATVAERAGIPHVADEQGSKADRLAHLAACAAACTRCGLAKTRNKVVFGEGNPEAKLVFVGEAPGADEDSSGRPFVGRAGKLLTKIIEAMGFAREDVFICNVLKCRPPGNRNPAPDEIVHCSPFLHEQLAVIEPTVICSLGGPSTTTLLDVKQGITRLRGRFFRYRGIPLMPTFHPAYLLRNMREKVKVWEDMKKLLRFLAQKS